MLDELLVVPLGELTETKVKSATVATLGTIAAGSLTDAIVSQQSARNR